MSEPNNTSLEGQDQTPVTDEEERDSALTLKGGMALPSLGWAKGPQGYLSEVREEFKKVTWPTRQQIVTETTVVLFVVIFLTALITLFDWVFSLIANRFLV